MSRKKNNLGQSTLILVLFGALFGWNILAKSDGGLHAVGTFDQGLRHPDEIVALRSEFELAGEGRTVRVQVNRGQTGEVIIDLANFFLGDGMILSSTERTRVREADSWEPVQFGLAGDDRIVVIEPEASWGKVHRDSGYQLRCRIEE